MPKSPAVFVVFEGLDGTGKSRCAELTANMLGAELMSTPTKQCRETCNTLVQRFGESQEAAHALYLATVLDASEKIRKHLANGRSVVLDRYLLSTEVYAAFRGSRLSLGESVLGLLQPADWTIFLEAPLAVRRARIAQRGCTFADTETLSQSADQALIAGFDQRAHLPIAGKAARFDTSIGTPEDVANAIVNHIIAHSGA